MSNGESVEYLMYFLVQSEIEDLVNSATLDFTVEQIRDFKVYESDLEMDIEDLTGAYMLVPFRRVWDEGFQEGSDNVFGEELEESNSLEEEKPSKEVRDMKKESSTEFLLETRSELKKVKGTKEAELIEIFQKTQSQKSLGNVLDRKNLINKKAG